MVADPSLFHDLHQILVVGALCNIPSIAEHVLHRHPARTYHTHVLCLTFDLPLLFFLNAWSLQNPRAPPPKKRSDRPTGISTSPLETLAQLLAPLTVPALSQTRGAGPSIYFNSSSPVAQLSAV